MPAGNGMVRSVSADRHSHAGISNTHKPCGLRRDGPGPALTNTVIEEFIYPDDSDIVVPDSEGESSDEELEYLNDVGGESLVCPSSLAPFSCSTLTLAPFPMFDNLLATLTPFRRSTTSHNTLQIPAPFQCSTTTSLAPYVQQPPPPTTPLLLPSNVGQHQVDKRSRKLEKSPQDVPPRGSFTPSIHPPCLRGQFHTCSNPRDGPLVHAMEEA